MVKALSQILRRWERRRRNGSSSSSRTDWSGGRLGSDERPSGVGAAEERLSDATRALMALGFKQAEAHESVRTAQAALGAQAPSNNWCAPG